MNKYEVIQKLLSEYKFNKARISFLENHIKRLTPETYNDYIEYKMFSPGYSGSTSKFIMDGGEEIAQLNKVEETSHEYKEKCEKEFEKATKAIEKEIKMLTYYTGMVEDALETLERIDKKYRVILEKYYITDISMESIAQSVHVSRSRCYELCKEALEWAIKIVYGESSYLYLKFGELPLQPKAHQ